MRFMMLMIPDVYQKPGPAPALPDPRAIAEMGVFNEGYAATSGSAWMRSELCDEALRLGRVLAELASAEPEVHGLVALMELQSSRFRARVRADGQPVLLLEQNRALWDPLLIRRGLAAIDRASGLGGDRGNYTLQASIAACHDRAPSADEPDWEEISALYAQLGRIAPSPVVELNRAVAVSMAFGAQAGLDILDLVADDPVLRKNHYLPSVRGDLLFKLGSLEAARAEFERAARMTRNERERELLLARAQTCVSPDEWLPDSPR